MQWIKIKEDFLKDIIAEAEKKKWAYRENPNNENYIEADSCIDVVKYILGNSESDPSPSDPVNREALSIEQMHEVIRLVSWAGWKSAANAYRVYPENKHTFTDYWNALGKEDAEKTLTEALNKAKQIPPTP